MRPRTRVLVALFAFAVAAALVGTAVAQQPPSVKRTVVGKYDIPGCADREAVMVWVEIPVGGAEGKHTHNAEVYAFVLEGTVALDAEGKARETFKAGDTFRYSPGGWHEAINVGTTPAKFAVVFNAEKGKPLTSPVK